MRLPATIVMAVILGLGIGCRGQSTKPYDEDPALQCKVLNSLAQELLTAEQLEPTHTILDPETLRAYLAGRVDALWENPKKGQLPEKAFNRLFRVKYCLDEWRRPSPQTRTAWAQKREILSKRIQASDPTLVLENRLEVSGPRATILIERKGHPPEADEAETRRRNFASGDFGSASLPCVLGFEELRLVYPSGKSIVVKLTPFGPDMSTFKTDL